VLHVSMLGRHCAVDELCLNSAALSCEQSCLDSEIRLDKEKPKFRNSLILGRNSFNESWTHVIKVTEGSFIPYSGIIKMETKVGFRCYLDCCFLEFHLLRS